MEFDICSVFILQGIFLLIGVVLRVKIPPINELWGFKTRRASKDKESWTFANKLFAMLLIIFSLLFVTIGSVLLICKYIFDKDIEFVGYLTIIIPIFPILITEVSLIFREKRN